VFDLRSVTLAPGEHYRAEIAVAIPPFTVGGEAYTATPDPCGVAFAVTRLRDGFVFEERFDVVVHGPCHRCLGAASTPLGVEAEEYHALHPEPGAEEEMTSPYFHDETIDTERMAVDAVILAMPIQVLCREDCRGLCAGCGADLNAGPCQCPPEEPDGRWSALRGLIEPDAQ
jgi:uncharacterized protein